MVDASQKTGTTSHSSPCYNDYGDPLEAAARVVEVFGEPTGEIRTQLADLQANFAGPSDQGATAYAEQFTLGHPETGWSVAATDAILAVSTFVGKLLG